MTSVTLDTNERTAPVAGLGITALFAAVATWAISQLVSASNAYDTLAFSSIACALGLIRLKTWRGIPGDLVEAPVALASIPFLGPAAGVPAVLATLARLASQDEDHSLRHCALELLRNCGAAIAAGLLFSLVSGGLANVASVIPLQAALVSTAVFVAIRLVPQLKESIRDGNLRTALAGHVVIGISGIVLAFWCQFCPRHVMTVTGALMAAAYAAKGLIAEQPVPAAQQSVEIPQVRVESSEPARPSMIDPLTGLANDRYLYMFLQQEIGRSVRKNIPLSLVLLDIDDFQSINDSHGRDLADAAMIELGKLVKGLIREYDLVARDSSDEFAVVLPEASCSDALDTAERIRERIAGYEFNSGLKLKVSLGVASYPEHGMTPDNLMSSAHHALNRAKFSGKDQAVSCTEIVSKLKYGT